MIALPIVLIAACGAAERSNRTQPTARGAGGDLYADVFEKVGCPTCEDLRSLKPDYLEYTVQRGCELPKCD